MRITRLTIGAPVLTTVLFILIFGYSLGTQIEEISSFSYIVYIIPGLTAMAAMTNAFSNSSTSLFMARIDRSVENMVTSPIPPLQIVLGFVIGGLLRGLLVGWITLIVAWLMTDASVHSPPLVLAYLLLSSLLFSSLGIIWALLANEWDDLGHFSSFVMTPAIYLGGVFYSITMLPPFWARLSLFNPVLYLISGFRFALLGVSDVSPIQSIAVSLTLAALSFGLAVWMFYRGYKIII
jgi:ABC-2 type transport system permease protein